MNLLIVGAPGAGKGTMSELIVSNFKITHVSTGDMLRGAIRENTPVGIKAAEYMNQGLLVPDSIIHDIILERLNKDDLNSGFLFDGYPRTLPQAEDLQDILSSLGKKLDAVIDLEIDEKILVKRITGRRCCPKCGEIYNIHNLPPKEEGKCDKCGADLIIRKDDNEESLKIRLNEYHHNTEPIIGFYEKMGLVYKIDGSFGIDETFSRVKTILEGLK